MTDWSLVDTQLMRELLEELEMDVNTPDGNGDTWLCFCTKKGLTDDVRRLLEYGANVNAEDGDGCIPLYHALRADNLQVVDLLLPRSNLDIVDRLKGTALHVVTRGQVHLRGPQYLTRLIALGVPLDVHDKAKNTAVAQAVWNHDFPSARVLVDAGCSLDEINTHGDTALGRLTWESCRPEHWDDTAAMGQLLIKAGADVDLVDEDGLSPVLNAATCRNFPILRLLLDANCTVKTDRNIHIERQGDYHRSDIPKFMIAAIDNNAEDCARFILGDSCRTSVDQEFFYQLSQQPEVNAGSLGLTRPPLSLFRKCRLAIRASLPQGPAFLNAVDQLELPLHVKDFLVLRK